MAKSNITVISLLKKPKEEFAKVLADKLEMCYVDTDDLMDFENISMKEILDTLGPKYYNKIEAKTIETVATYENSVITTGTGSIFATNNLDIVKKHSLVLYLQINFKVYKKYKNVDATEINKAKLIMDEMVFAERDKLYCSSADIVVDASSLKTKKVLKKAIKAIKKYYAKK